MTGRAEALRLAAFVAVTRGTDPDYYLRRVHRWYSREFHTPLHLVDELSPDDVLRAYFEVNFETMVEGNDQEAVNKERDYLLQTDQDRREERFRADRDKAEADDYAKRIRAEEKAKGEQQSRDAVDLAAAVEKVKVALGDLPDRVAINFGSLGDEEPLGQ